MKVVSPKYLTYFLIIFVGLGIILNLVEHEPAIQDTQYGMLGIYGLAYVTSYLRMPRLNFYVIYFVLWMVVMRQTGGYYDWTSWIVFAFVAAFMTWVTDLIRTSYASRYDQPKKHKHPDDKTQ
ncbi:hypothetical protein [Lentilactobacillus parabuchneri]|nr:hypothetical protein [Lentilactobacillus parabuchneri]MCW4397477.1 hypothetical protein [Lentilactobacillus parabuchneri]MDB1103469.1 hypothetical protein [Lentilactobacillus parabuchneri]MDN6780851.1 hypothetical protein [Lentilactobacillus parabuchneri]MDN6787866.1 hypothetical protein [Lentilactobacillus parabuchneri]MDN6809796.1 hypothetical protein [Lentilactobacillus parabuchneri]